VDLMSLIRSALEVVGLTLLGVGLFCNVVGAIGMVRFPNFYVRLHAATVSSIGGAFYPILGVALIALTLNEPVEVKLPIATGCILVAVLIVLTSPVGAHAIARAAYKSGVKFEPKACDMLKEDENP